jgi:hypothetical protein
MPVSRRRKRNKPKTKTSISQPETSGTKQAIVSRLTAILLGAATLVGGAAAVITFWPRMTVTPSGLFDESNAYSETFTIANTGFLALEDVQIGVGICTIDTAKHDFFVSPNNCDQTGPHMLIGGPSWETPELRRDEPFSIVLSDGLNVATDKWRAAHPNVIAGFQMMSELTAANVIVAVTFKPWPLSWQITNRYRFVAEQQSNGKMMWRAVPLSWRNIKLPD